MMEDTVGPDGSRRMTSFYHLDTSSLEMAKHNKLVSGEVIDQQEAFYFRPYSYMPHGI